MKTKTILLLLISACGALFIAAVASCAGYFFLTFRNMDATLSPTIDELFAAIDNDTFVETYDTCTSSELRKTVTREQYEDCLLYTSPSPRDRTRSRMPSSA